MKKIARAMLYWVPVMFKSGKRPSILALPVEKISQQDVGQPNEGDSRTGDRLPGLVSKKERRLPMFARSMNEIRYNTRSIGTSLQSTLRTTAFL